MTRPRSTVHGTDVTCSLCLRVIAAFHLVFRTASGSTLCTTCAGTDRPDDREAA